MPVSSNFSLDSYGSSVRESRGRRSSESSTASDATREVTADATEHIPTRRAGVGPKPAANPMKFVAAGPAPLLRTASEQMLKAEKLRLAAKPAVKEEEGTAWQNNLDSWKSNRRKRQEDVIERLTEVKKLEEQENGRGAGRRNKTFGEMMQERAGDRRGRRVLQVFTDDDNDISSLLSAKSPASSDTRSDLGFATSSDTGSEPSDHQEVLEKSVAVTSPPPAAGESNGHDSGTEECTYDSAIQGYIKFAEKSRCIRPPAPAAAPEGRSLSADSAPPLRQSSPLPTAADMDDTRPPPPASSVKTGRPSVVLRDKKARVDVHKRRSLFEERTCTTEERSVSAAQRRLNRKSTDLSDGLRHRIASLETVAGVGDDSPWRPPVKTDKFMQKLAMFASLESSREASADRRSFEPIPRQKSASDLRSKFEQMAAEERCTLERRPSGANTAERRQNGLNSLERRKSASSSLDRRGNIYSSLERSGSGPHSLENRESVHSSLENRSDGPSSLSSSEGRSVSVNSEPRTWQEKSVVTSEISDHRTEEVLEGFTDNIATSSGLPPNARGSSQQAAHFSTEKVSSLSVEQASSSDAVSAADCTKGDTHTETLVSSSTSHQLTESVTSPVPSVVSGWPEVAPPEPAVRAAPVPMVRRSVLAATAAPHPSDTNTLHVAPTNPEVEGPERSEAPAVVEEVVERCRVERPVHQANIYRLFHQDIHISSSVSRQPKPAPAASIPPPAAVPAAEPEPAPEPAPAAAEAVEPVDTPVEPVEPVEPPSSAAEMVGWQDPAAVADQMEAQILRQLEENERSQLSPAEEPVVMEFPLQPSTAAPPSEKPPPPPPGSDEEEEEPVMRGTKSTSDVKKNLYRRRSDFLGIQGQQESEPEAAVARPPDMESLLRQERAVQQQQERRWQQQQSREESLRRAEAEAEQRAEEFRRRAVIEKEQRDRERRAVEAELEKQEQQERQRRAQEQALQQERRAQEQQMERERCAQEQQFEMDRRAKEQQLIEQEQRQKEQQLVEQERRQKEQQLIDQERRAQEQQFIEQKRRANEQMYLEHDRYAQDQQLVGQDQELAGESRWDAEQQDREWRRRKQLLSTDEEADHQERHIMESLEQEESWRHQQHAKYQSRLARLAAAEHTWQRTQEAPAGPAASADLLSSRQQARSNPNLLEDTAASSLLAASRSYSDLAAQPAPAAAPLQQSRSHGRLYPQQQPQQQPPQPRHQRSLPNHSQPPQTKPAKPHRTAEQDGRIPWTAPALAPQPQPAASPPGPMSRHTLTTLAAAPRPTLRQEWVPRKRPDAARNTGQHWLIQEAEQRRISAQQERSSRQQQQQQPPAPPAGYAAPRAPPPVQQKQPSPLLQQQQQYPAYYTHQPIYENTPAQLLNANNNNNYQDVSGVTRLGYGTPVYQSGEVSPPRPEPVSPASAGQSPEERVLSVSGRKKCSHCGEELGRGAAMIIESLRLFYHISCFKCCVCNVQLGNGSMGADVRVRNNKLHCHDCYSNDEGLKFSKV